MTERADPKGAEASEAAWIRRRRILLLMILAVWGLVIFAITRLKTVSVGTVAFLVLAGGPLFAILWWRCRCSRCGKAFLEISSQREENLCPSCEPRPPSKLHLAFAALFFLALLVMFGWYPGAVLAQNGVPPVLAHAIGIPCGVALFLALFFCRQESRSAGKRLLHWVLRQNERRDFEAAKRATGNPGQVIRRGMLTLWTDATKDILPELEAGVSYAIRRFAEITAFPAHFKSPLRVLCFQGEAAFAAYAHAMYGPLGPLGGAYDGHLRKRVLVNLQAADRPPSTLLWVIAHEVAHHLARSWFQKTPPFWLSEGLAQLVAAEPGAALCAPGADLRYLRSIQARGELLSADRLFAFNYLALSKRQRDWRNINTAALYSTAYSQSAGLLDFLFKQDPVGFRRFLASAGGKPKPERFFERAFGSAPEVAIARWRDRLLATPPPPHQEPPDTVKKRVESELIPVIRESQAATDDRRKAIRSLSAAGYTWWADVLIETLDDADQTLRAEAQRALEAIAGELHRDKSDWLQWLKSVPVRSAKQS